MRLKKKAQEISAVAAQPMMIGKKLSSQPFELQYQKIMIKLEDRRPENYQYLNQLIKCSQEYRELETSGRLLITKPGLTNMILDLAKKMLKEII